MGHFPSTGGGSISQITAGIGIHVATDFGPTATVSATGTFAGEGIKTTSTITGTKIISSGRIFANATPGTLNLRPNGPTSASNQIVISVAGTLRALTLRGKVVRTTTGIYSIINPGTLLLRPNGSASTTGQLVVTTAGLVKLSSGGSFVTTASVVVSIPTVASGTAFTPSSTKDSIFSCFLATTTGVLKVTAGPTTGTENTLVNTTGTHSFYFSDRIPAGWKVVVTFASGSIANRLVRTC